MEAILLTFTANLGPALIKVIEKLGEKAVNPVLEKGFKPFHNWISHGYDQAKTEADLHEALMNALDDLKLYLEKDPYERLFAIMKFTGLNANTWRTLAAAAVEMVRINPNNIPDSLMKALELELENKVLLARFLYYLRKHLVKVDGFRTGIKYANELENHGLLAGIARETSEIAIHTSRTADGVDKLLAHLSIATDDNSATRDYLEIMRSQLQYVPLPLADPGSAVMSQTDAELRQIFVPLTVRDLNANEIVSIVDLISRHKRFVLIGGAGCGKTTLLKMAALAFVENHSEVLSWSEKPLFPIFLQLRNFGAFLTQNPTYTEPGPGALTAYLTYHFSQSYDIDLTTDFFPSRLKKGNCLILLDGLDEVSKQRANVARQVNAFIRYYQSNGNRFALASRPRGYESVEEYLRPSSLASCVVNPLSRSGICKLISNILGWIVNDPKQFAQDKEKLIEKILTSRTLTKLASTPLFCTALTLVYKYHGSDLPERRVDVLEQVVDLLLGFWTAQKPGLAKGHELAIFDGTDLIEVDLDMAVANKRSRLSHLAYQMQISEQKAEVAGEKAQKWLQAYIEEHEGQSVETAKKWAIGFLSYAHAYSGLFVEQEGPGAFVFTHEGFREYLAARELIDMGEKAFIETILNNILDDQWEQVILLAASFRGYSRRARLDLINEALKYSNQLYETNHKSWLRCLTMTGAMARDMDKYLPLPKRREIENHIHAKMVDESLKPNIRSVAADALDELGYLPDDLYCFVSTPNEHSTKLHVARYPVTNSQYNRFLRSNDFGKKEYWIDFPKFSEPDKETGEVKLVGDWGDEGWEWLQDALQDEEKTSDREVVLPRYWNDLRFGSTRKGFPVVGITWYEANAYCKWLLEHWDELSEAEQNTNLKPKLIRLPTEHEWTLAAGGEDPSDRYPWEKADHVTTKREDFLRCANIGIGHTTPVFMYPLGVSLNGVWDMSGNVWEWQANYHGSIVLGEKTLALRGGNVGGGISARQDHHPDINWKRIGFRLVAL